jgi:hypothetical protein
MRKLHFPKQQLLSAFCLSAACAAVLLTTEATATSVKAIKPLPTRSGLTCNDPCSSSSECSGMCSVCHPLNSYYSVCYLH